MIDAWENGTSVLMCEEFKFLRDRMTWITVAALLGMGGPVLAGALFVGTHSIAGWAVASALLVTSGLLLTHVLMLMHAFGRVRGAWDVWLSR